MVQTTDPLTLGRGWGRAETGKSLAALLQSGGASDLSKTGRDAPSSEVGSARGEILILTTANSVSKLLRV